ncbi:MAG TPA: glycosyltransferase [Puia sp.]|nr:glycosyltransferase [Puia sp.]
MEKQAIGAADLLVTPTRFIADEIQNYTDLSKKKVHLLANPYRSGENEPPERFLRNKIVYYGKLSPQKGSFELLKYFKDLWDSGFRHPLYIIGGTDIVYHPEMQTMGQWVEKHYADYIAGGLLQLLGKIQPRQIKEQLSDAHLIIVPSIVDNLPYVVMETMSLGKVVLASRQGGQREMIEDGVSGFLFDHDVPGDFAARLLMILSLPDDEVQRIGSRACQRVRESYAFDVVGPQKIGLLQQMKSQSMPKDHFPFLHQEKSIPLENYQIPDGRLTVVIPYYNMGPYIEECVRSVMDSTYKNLEVLIVNDGSSDPASIEKLKSFESQEKVRVFHQKNQGLALTRNEGARQAVGTYLAFLDADDKVAPSYYEKTITALKKNTNVYFAGAWVQYFENSRQLWPTFTPQPPYLFVHNPVNSSGLVYKRAAFLQGGLNDKRTDYGLEDYESVVNMMHHGFNGVVVPEVLFHYRVRSGSMFRAISREKLLYSNKYIIEKHADYYTKFAAQIVNLLNANGPGYLFDNPTLEVRVNSKMIRDNVVLLKIKSLVKGSQKLKKIVLSIKKFKR